MSTFSISRASLVTAISAVLLQGCGGEANIRPTTQTLEPDTRLMLQQGVYLQQLSARCDHLGGDIAEQAITVKEQWFQRNGRLVAYADDHWEQKRLNSTFEYRGERLSMEALSTLNKTTQQLDRQLGFNKVSRRSHVRACSNLLAPFADPANDFQQNPTLAATLAYINDQTSGYNLAVDGRLPSLTGDIEPAMKQGRSAYTVESVLKEQQCQEPITVTFVNQWPNELYGSQCKDGQAMVVRCSWGNCSIEQ